jgi:hypothetical protein
LQYLSLFFKESFFAIIDKSTVKNSKNAYFASFFLSINFNQKIDKKDYFLGLKDKKNERASQVQ